MKAIQRDFADRGVRLVAISSNDASRYPEDSFEEMKGRADREGFNFDYLYDENQSVARALGSERTPEIFLFDRERRLVYHGAIDDKGAGRWHAGGRDDEPVRHRSFRRAHACTHIAGAGCCHAGYHDCRQFRHRRGNDADG